MAIVMGRVGPRQLNTNPRNQNYSNSIGIWMETLNFSAMYCDTLPQSMRPLSSQPKPFETIEPLLTKVCCVQYIQSRMFIKQRRNYLGSVVDNLYLFYCEMKDTLTKNH